MQHNSGKQRTQDSAAPYAEQAPFEQPYGEPPCQQGAGQQGFYTPPPDYGQASMPLKSSGRGFPFDEDDFFGDDASPLEGQASLHPAPEDVAIPLSGATVARKKRGGLVSVVMTLAVLLVAGIVLNTQVFKLTSIEILGVDASQREAVLSTSGLKQNMSFLSVNEAQIKSNVENDRYLKFVSLEKHFPSGVTLTVSRRAPRANLMVMGVLYIISEDGMVLERSTQMTLDNGCITITGMQVHELRVGSVFSPQRQAQFESYTAVLNELVAQSYTSEISELNLSDLNSLYLITTDGYTVNLGTSADIRAKIGTVRAVVKELRQMGKTGGMIEASVPGSAIYSPPNV